MAESLLDLANAVRRNGPTWLTNYPRIAELANRLGKPGFETFATMLAEADEQNEPRMVSCLQFAAKKISPEVCEALCDWVEVPYAESFGGAASHHGAAAIDLLRRKIAGAPDDRKPAFRAMLAGMFDSVADLDDALRVSSLVHKDPEVRAAAAGTDFDDATRKNLLALVKDRDENVRYRFASADWYVGDDVPVPLLLQMASDPSPRVRAAIAEKLDPDEADQLTTLKRLATDPDPAVAANAAEGLDESEPDHEAARAKRAEVERAGNADALAETIRTTWADHESLKWIAQVVLRNPPIQVMRAAEIQLAYSDVPDSVPLAAPLLDRSLLPRIRRVGFQVFAPHRETWPRFLEPLLTPEEPLLDDLLYHVEAELYGEVGAERGFLERLKSKYPRTRLEKFATEALAEK